MNEMRDKDRVMDNAVTCRMERLLIEGITKNASAVIKIPRKTLSRNTPLIVIAAMPNIIYTFPIVRNKRARVDKQHQPSVYASARTFM